MKTVLAFLFVLLLSGSIPAQDLPPEVLADKYLLEAEQAIKKGNTQGALRAFRKIEVLDTEKPPEFTYFYGKLLVENSTMLADLRKGHSYLKQFILSVGRDSEHYRPTLELLTATEEKLEKAEVAEAQLKARLPQLLAILGRQMVRVRGGTFTMGCTPEQGSCSGHEKPAHQVRVMDFQISKYEVTQQFWALVMGTGPIGSTNCAQCPAEFVSWDNIQNFFKALNLTGAQYRLPTEAEWEYAARGGQQSRGYRYAGSDNPDAVAWYWDRDKDKSENMRTHPVGQKQANELGLYDMSGGAEER